MWVADTSPLVMHILRQAWYIALGMISAYVVRKAPVWWKGLIAGIIVAVVLYVVGELGLSFARKIQRRKLGARGLKPD